MNVGLDGQYASWVGTLANPDHPLVLVTPAGREEESVMRLARVGYENIVGIVEGGCPAWEKAGLPTASTEQQLSSQALTSGRRVLDVRRPGEVEAGHVKGATHIPLAQLPQQIDTLDKTASWTVVCASGYRSSTATSLMERAGIHRRDERRRRDAALSAAGLPVETGA